MNIGINRENFRGSVWRSWTGKNTLQKKGVSVRPSLPGPKNNAENKLVFASKENRQTAPNPANRKNGRKPNLGQTESGTKRQRYHNREKKEKGKKREGKTEKGKTKRGKDRKKERWWEKKPQNKGKKEKRKERRKNKKTAKERKGERKEEKKLKRKLKKPLPPKQPKVKKPFRQKRNNRYPPVNRETAKLTICLWSKVRDAAKLTVWSWSTARGGTVPTLKHSAPSKTGETVRHIIKLQIFRIICLAGRAAHRKIPT